MGLLSKLFGAKLEEAAVGLEAAGQRRSAPRVLLQPLHRISFSARGKCASQLAESRADALELGIANVSLSGIGFTRESAQAWPDPGTLLVGELEAEGNKVEVEAKLVHLTGRVAGCSFHGNIVPIQKLVLDYFRVELAGLNMLHAPDDVLKAETDGTPHWYHGRNNCELFYVAKLGEPEALVRYQLSFFANYVEGVVGGHPRFGTVVEDHDDTGKPKHKGAELVSWAEAPDPQLIETIVKFLRHVPGLPVPVREELAKQIRWVREKKK